MPQSEDVEEHRELTKDSLYNVPNVPHKNVHEPDKNKCSHCGKKGQTMKDCSKCESAADCSRECQLAHVSVAFKICFEICILLTLSFHLSSGQVIRICVK